MEGRARRIGVTFVLPVYNCAGNLIPLFKELETVAVTFPEYELHYIFVDDASSDESWQELNSISSPQIKLIKLKENLGSYAAVCEGLKRVRGDKVVVMAADGQDDPKVAFGLLESLPRQGLAIACRKKSNNGILAKLYHWIMCKRLGAGASEAIIDMAAFSVSDIPEVLNDSRSRIHLFYALDARFSKKHVINCEKRTRVVGNSGWTFQKKVKLFIASLVRF